MHLYEKVDLDDLHGLALHILFPHLRLSCGLACCERRVRASIAAGVATTVTKAGSLARSRCHKLRASNSIGSKRGNSIQMRNRVNQPTTARGSSFRLLNRVPVRSLFRYSLISVFLFQHTPCLPAALFGRCCRYGRWWHGGQFPHHNCRKANASIYLFVNMHLTTLVRRCPRRCAFFSLLLVKHYSSLRFWAQKKKKKKSRREDLTSADSPPDPPPRSYS